MEIPREYVSVRIRLRVTGIATTMYSSAQRLRELPVVTYSAPPSVDNSKTQSLSALTSGDATKVCAAGLASFLPVKLQL